MENIKRYKITDITEIRYRTKEYRDSEGKLQRTKQEYLAYREVQVIQGWARFAHYLIDTVFLSIIRYGINFGIGFAIGSGVMRGGNDLSLQLGLSLFGIFINLIYYTIFEAMYASTPGKLLLGRVVIDEYGQRPETGTVMLRSLSRMVPFEAFSCLSERGWHDRWTKTFVVSKEEAARLAELLVVLERDTAQREADDFRKTQSVDHNLQS
ncbi:MAG TPA: RDD family protein [Bacteroidia bacterium]|nr:RDD family protein [Bacteroidia bacterium]